MSGNLSFSSRLLYDFTNVFERWNSMDLASGTLRIYDLHVFTLLVQFCGIELALLKD